MFLIWLMVSLFGFGIYFLLIAIVMLLFIISGGVSGNVR